MDATNNRFYHESTTTLDASRLAQLLETVRQCRPAWLEAVYPPGTEVCRDEQVLGLVDVLDAFERITAERPAGLSELADWIEQRPSVEDYITVQIPIDQRDDVVAALRRAAGNAGECEQCNGSGRDTVRFNHDHLPCPSCGGSGKSAPPQPAPDALQRILCGIVGTPDANGMVTFKVHESVVRQMQAAAQPAPDALRAELAEEEKTILEFFDNAENADLADETWSLNATGARKALNTILEAALSNADQPRK